jgi:hypothetical protein
MIGMADPEMSRERIIPGEGLLFGAQMTAHFLLSRVVDRVFMSSEIIRPREDGVARLAR